jgi:hypothetical protein
MEAALAHARDAARDADWPRAASQAAGALALWRGTQDRGRAQSQLFSSRRDSERGET